MQHSFQLNRKDSRRKSLLLSILFHIILFLLLLLPTLSYFDPPREIQGVTILMSELPEPRRETRAAAVSAKKETPAASNTSPEPQAPKPAEPEKVSKAKAKKVNVLKSEASPVVTGSSVKQENSGPTEEEIAAAKAEEQEKKKEAAKSKFSSLFGSSTTESDNTSEVGRPDASAVEGLKDNFTATGEGLESRGIVYQPDITDNSQKTGRVVVRICVNKSGLVTSARFTQKGSTTTDNYLIDLAEKNALKYRFTESTLDEQCGNIVIDFRLR